MADGFIDESGHTVRKAVLNIHLMFIAMGATVMASSNTATYNASGNQITVLGDINAGSWARYRFNGEEWTMQFGGTNYSGVRFKYSPTGGTTTPFTGGTPGLLQTPTSTLEFVIRGAGTDAAPTYTTWIPSTDATFKQAGFAKGSAPFTWWIVFHAPGTGVMQTFIGWDELKDLVPNNVCKRAYYSISGPPNAAGLNQSSNTAYSASAVNPIVGVFDPQTAWATTTLRYGSLAAWYTGSGSTPLYLNSGGTGGHSADAVNSEDTGAELRVCRVGSGPVTPSYDVGASQLFRLMGQTRANGSTLSTVGVGTMDRIVWGDLSVPWRGAAYSLLWPTFPHARSAGRARVFGRLGLPPAPGSGGSFSRPGTSWAGTTWTSLAVPNRFALGLLTAAQTLPGYNDPRATSVRARRPLSQQPFFRG